MNLVNRTVNHPGDQFFFVGVGDALGRDQLAVAQDGDAVCELEDFFEPMGNINNGARPGP